MKLGLLSVSTQLIFALLRRANMSCLAEYESRYGNSHALIYTYCP
jgi:hypothetical protein